MCRARLEGALSSPTWWEAALPLAGAQNRVLCEVPSNSVIRNTPSPRPIAPSPSGPCLSTQGAVKRQALYACSTCTPPGAEPAGICLACSYECHGSHRLFELYTKRYGAGGAPDAPQRLAPGNGCSEVAQGGGGGGLVLAGLAFGSAAGGVARLCRYSAGPAAWAGCKSALTAAKQLLGVVMCTKDKVLLPNPISEMLCSPSQELPL